MTFARPVGLRYRYGNQESRHLRRPADPLVARTGTTRGCRTIASPTTWLSTVSPDGHPHLAGVGALWVDGIFYLSSGPGTQKSRNLAANPSCALSMAIPGLDLVVEGRAAKVTDQATLERLAQRYVAQGWPARASDGALTAEFSAPSAGPPPWHL